MVIRTSVLRELLGRVNRSIAYVAATKKPMRQRLPIRDSPEPLNSPVLSMPSLLQHSNPKDIKTELTKTPLQPSSSVATETMQIVTLTLVSLMENALTCPNHGMIRNRSNRRRLESEHQNPNASPLGFLERLLRSNRIHSMDDQERSRCEHLDQDELSAGKEEPVVC